MSSYLGEYLRSLRNEKGLTTREVGEIAECSHTFVIRIERGERFPSIQRLWRMTSGLGGDFGRALFFLCLDSGVPEDVAREATGQ